ncbi:MAG: ATP-binding cassette domain-containing protein [Pseudomonadota bacterium]
MSPGRLRVSNLTAGYDRDIVSGVTFEGKAGEILVLMGRSGSGKSTLLKAIAGQIPFAGSISFTDAGIETVSFLYQSPYAFPWLTAVNNVREATGVSAQSARTLLDGIKLETAHAKYPFEMSGGMLRRLGLMMALNGPQNIILLDEPFTGLDDWTKELAFEAVESAARTHKKLVILTTHSVEEALIIGDVILSLSGEPSDIAFQYRTQIERPRYGPQIDGAELGSAISAVRKNLAAVT